MARVTPAALQRQLLILLLLSCAPLQAQPSGDTPRPKSDSNSAEPARVVGVIPAFNSSDDANAPALSSKQKLRLFTRTVTDPFNLIMPAVNAAILSATGDSSGYGSGFSGAAKRYGSSLADATTGNFFRLYAYPALLHEDPRYFRAGSGSIPKRTMHVFVAVVRTRKDEPKFRFNWSKLFASASSAGLSNLYYPDENRGWSLTLSRIGLSYATEVGSNALKEFWPDIAKVMRKKKAKADSLQVPKSDGDRSTE
jgi:hypothetical protein